MKLKILIYLFIIFFIGCKKKEYYGSPVNPPVFYPHNFTIKGEWLLTSAKRITRHTTQNWGDSINFFWYPTHPYPLKYNRGRIYDTIEVGSTHWKINEETITHNIEEFYYERKHANSPYCDQLLLDFYDTYMVVYIDSFTFVLETNKQSDVNSGLFLFDHFTILEFQRIDSATISNTHYYNSELGYCLELNKYDTSTVWNPHYEVVPYSPY